MAKKKEVVIPYIKKEDNTIYIHIQRKKLLLTPIPYVWKPNYHYLLKILKK